MSEEGIQLPLLIVQKIRNYIKLMKDKEKIQQIVNGLFRPTAQPNIIFHNLPHSNYTNNHDIYCYDNNYHHITTDDYSHYFKIKHATYNAANPYKFYHPI